MATKIQPQDVDTTQTFVLSASQFSDGSAASPAVTFASDPDVGMYHIAANTLGFATNGAEAMRIDSAGKVGIGTTPIDKFHVLGNIVVEHVGLGLDFLRSGYDEYIMGQIGTGFTIKNQTQTKTVLNADTNNKIGINTTSPTGNYQVRIDATNRLGLSIYSGASASAAYLFLENDGSNTWSVYNNGTSATGTKPNTLEWDYNGVEALRLNSSQLLHLDGSAASPSISFINATGTGVSRIGGALYFSVAGSPVCYIDGTSISTYSGSQTLGTAAQPWYTLYLRDGTAALPSMTFGSETNTGIYHPAANQLALTTAGTQRAVFFTDGVYLIPDATGTNFINLDNAGATASILPRPDGVWDIGRSGGTPFGLRRIFMKDGSAAAPSITFSSNDTTGIYRVGANSLGVSSGGAVSTTFDSNGLTTYANIQPNNDNVQTCGKSGQRWSAVWAANGTIQTSHSSTKEILGTISEDIPIPEGIMFKRPGSARIHVGFLADNLPKEAFYEDGVSIETSAPIGVLCVKLKQAFREIENLKQQIVLLQSK